MQPSPAIIYALNPNPLPSGEVILDLFERAGIGDEGWTPERLDRALAASDLIICAYAQDTIVGVGRAITDWARTAYLASLAVLPELQRRGIGRQIIVRMRETLGPEVSLVVHAAEGAQSFYERIGFEPRLDMYRVPRER
jgi:ribosomal protein S18 acetylase RimI-like enzyme